MRLSKKKAIELCIELWTWCALTGKPKEDWPRWKEFGYVINHCWFCKWDNRQRKRYNFREKSCHYCPIYKEFGFLCLHKNCFYERWENAKTPRTRKKYAKLFLEQIKQCK